MPPFKKAKYRAPYAPLRLHSIGSLASSGVNMAASRIQRAWRGKRKYGDSQSTIRSLPNTQSTIAGTRMRGIRTGRIVAEGTGGQYSSFTLKKGNYLEKSVDHTLAPIKSVFNSASQLTSAVGKQNCLAPMRLYDNADVAILYADVIGGTAGRIVLSKVQATLMLSNIFLSNVSVDIYDVISRKDMPTSITDAVTAWSLGDTDEGAATEYQKIGSTPFQTETFNQYFRVAQVTRVVLGAGQMHKHHINLDMHQLMTYAYMTYTPKGYRELTYNTVLVIRGAPANDSTTQTSVTVGAGGVNIVMEKEYLTKQLAQGVAAVKDHSNLSTSFAVGEQVVNVGGSTITANAEG